MQTIGKEAFSDCTAVTKVISRADTPPTCGSQALDDINKWNCTLSVPEGHTAAYQAADQWKEFFFIEEGGEVLTPDEPEVKKCEKPEIRYSNGKLTFACGTPGAVCNSTITDSDIHAYTGNEVQLSVTYQISVYATLPGYEDSEVATATLCWIDVDPQTEGIIEDTPTDVLNVKAHPVLIQAEQDAVLVTGAETGSPIRVYNLSGHLIGSGAAAGETTRIRIKSESRGQVVVVQIGEKAVKVKAQ